MVLARVLAEATVMVLLLLLPLILHLLGHFLGLPITFKVVLIALAIIACLMLPAYGFITHSVLVEDEGLRARALFRQERCTWRSIKAVKRRSNWNWQRYVVEHDDGELSFPIWLNEVDKLVETIRSRLPQSAGGRSSPLSRFSQDPIALTFQFVQAFIGIAFAVVFWFFFLDLRAGVQKSEDILIVLIFCILITALVTWRTIMILLMPRQIIVSPGELTLQTLFFKRILTWNQVLSVKPTMPLLPDGFLIRTEKWAYLIGGGIDGVDELVETLASRIPGQPTAKKS